MRWLVKEEPENYSYARFQADGRTVWAGVRNPVAQRNLRAMKKGENVFFYHTGKEKAVIGTATVAVALAEIKADKRFAGMPLVRIPRLSVQPVTDDEWDMIEAISKFA